MNKEIVSALIRILPFILIILVVSIRVKLGKTSTQELDINKPNSTGKFLLWTLGFLAFILLTEFALSKFGVLEISAWRASLYPSIIRILGAVILAPIAEELIFRGFILNVLVKRNLNLHVAILIQAVFFVALHNFAYENTLGSNIGIVQSLIDATLFAYARYQTQSIYTPITMHMTGNLIATLERFVLV